VHIDVVTIFPELFPAFLETSLIGRAIDADLLQVDVHDLRDHARDRHRIVDDEPYGGGGGMVMIAPPWLEAVRRISTESVAGVQPWRVLLSPQGRQLDDRKLRELARHPRLMLLCGRYEGVDERVIDLVVDEEISIGDYVLSGGEIPAMVLIEGISRQIPGVVGQTGSVEEDSFRRGLLDHPHYTRPRDVEGLKVPEALLSGDHAAIDRWRRKAALAATLTKRPDLLQGRDLTLEESELLAEIRRERGRGEVRSSSPGGADEQ
jgi:tRNA (guanine37-N1)-methyltransferase